MELKFCTNCLFPETKPDLFFDENGLCSACKAANQKKRWYRLGPKEEIFFEIVVQ